MDKNESESSTERFIQESLKFFYQLYDQLELQYSESSLCCTIPILQQTQTFFLHLLLFHFFQQHPSFPKNGYYEYLRAVPSEQIWKTLLFWMYPTFRERIQREQNFFSEMQFSFSENLNEKLEETYLQEIIKLPPTLLINSSRKNRGFLDRLSQESFSQDERTHPEQRTPFVLSEFFERFRQSVEKKSKGVFYTPPALVRYMCQKSVMAYLKNYLPELSIAEDFWPLEKKEIVFFLSQNATVIDRLLASVKICDLAVGTGAFPLGILREIVDLREYLTPYLALEVTIDRTRYTLKKQTVEHSLYGTDIDGQALEVFQWRLWFSLQSELPALKIPFVSMKNRFFSENPLTALRPEEVFPEAWPALSEKHFNLFFVFREIFQRSKGFDIVLGNPPYLKERENINLLQATKTSPFGQKYHQGKMDFWFYFLHQAIDITHDLGIIAFITPSYWLQSQGARKLRQRIQECLSFLSILDLGNLKVFHHVTGHHMIAFYAKRKQSDFFPYDQAQSIVPRLKLLRKSILKNSEIFTAHHEIMLHHFFSSGAKTVPLGSICHISQGVIEAPHRMTAKQIPPHLSSEIKAGQGVFVLSREEFDALQLTLEEKQICVPYVSPNFVRRYVLCPEEEYFLICADQENKQKIAYEPSFSRLRQHLDRYRAFITSVNAPYGLHRPRSREYFQRPKLIFKNMFLQNTCAYDEAGYFVGFSLSVIHSKDSQYPLKYLLALLNSTYAQKWFYAYGKRRGAGVDIGVEKLRNFPVKILPLEDQTLIIQKVERILSLKSDKKRDAEVESIEKELEVFFE